MKIRHDTALVLLFAIAGTLLGGCLEPQNHGPEALFDAVPTSGPCPLLVSFDASASHDPDGDVIAYSWDFGDGSTGFGQAVEHTYAATGSFTAVLTVTDEHGASGSTSATVGVSDPPIHQVGDSVASDGIHVLLKGVRRIKTISVLFSAPDGDIYAVANLECRSDGYDESVSVWDFDVVDSNGKRSPVSLATSNLDQPFNSAVLVEPGMSASGEIAFLVDASLSHYYLRYEPFLEEPVVFRFSL